MFIPTTFTPPAASPHLLDVRPHHYVPPRPGLAADTCQWVTDQAKRLHVHRPDDVLLAVTFQPNRTPGRAIDPEWSDTREKTWLNAFSLEMDRRHLGYGDRLRRMKRLRPWYLLVGQMGAGGLHYHGIASMPPDKIDVFQGAGPHVWKQLTRGGSMVIDDRLDAGWVSYLTRHLDGQKAMVCHIIPERQQTHH